MKFRTLGISIAFSLFLMASASAQSNEEMHNLVISATVGGSMTRITKDAFENAFGFGTGATARYYFVDFIGVGTGLEYEMRKLGTKDAVVNLEDGTAHYLDIPLLLSLRFGSASHQGTIDLGGVYAISMSSGELGQKTGYNTYVKAENAFGMNTRIGYSYFLKNNIGVGVESSLKYLPAGVMPLGVGTITDDNDQHFISLGLNLRLSYGLVL